MPITSTKKRRLSSGFGVKISRWPRWATSMIGSSCIPSPPLCDDDLTQGRSLVSCGRGGGTALRLAAPEPRKALRRLHAVPTLRGFRFRRGQIGDERARLVGLRRRAGDAGREDGHGLNLRRQGTGDVDVGKV